MDNPVDIEGVPTVTLAGRLWPIQILTAKQNKVIDPLILSLLPVFSKWHSDKSAALQGLDTRQYEALLDISFHAVRMVHPELIVQTPVLSWYGRPQKPSKYLIRDKADRLKLRIIN